MLRSLVDQRSGIARASERVRPSLRRNEGRWRVDKAKKGRNQGFSMWKRRRKRRRRLSE